MTLSAAALTLIRWYGQEVSPYKGYRCAHARYYGAASCSAVVEGIITARGVVGGWREVRAQFAACGLAAELLSQQATPINHLPCSGPVNPECEPACCGACGPIDDVCHACPLGSSSVSSKLQMAVGQEPAHLSEWLGAWKGKGTPHGAILPHAHSGSLAGPGQKEVRTWIPALNERRRHGRTSRRCPGTRDLSCDANCCDACEVADLACPWVSVRSGLLRALLRALARSGLAWWRARKRT
ncbi:membrane protein insertion efficiency factor YidD [Deinococcus hopiensis]|uniref:membrane protein insertion efficiency factor YidD n=1 Tax=Deinococcus hopiensis TaxID=309885 RepID=UPI001BAFAE3F